MNYELKSHQQLYSKITIYALKALNGFLDLLAHSSGYKVNVSKSILLGLNITRTVKEEIKEITTAHWKTSVRYLGLKLSE